MSDPRRFLQGRRGELETELMRSVRDDVPPASARARTMTALGIGGAALGTTAAASAAATVTATATAAKSAGVSVLAVMSKWLLVGIGTGVLTVAAARPITAVVERMTQGPRPAAENVLPAPHGSRESARAAALSTGLAAGSSDPRDGSLGSEPALSPPPVSPSSFVASMPPARANRGEDPRRADSTLSDEVAALDRVRMAAKSDLGEALRLLDAYGQQFPRGHLGPEARVLRIEALAKSGKTEQAAGLAREVLKTDPSGPHAERVRSVLSEISGQ